jgi:hypothetical protein
MVEWYFLLALFAAVVIIAFVITQVKNRKRESGHDPTVTDHEDIKSGRIHKTELEITYIARSSGD